MTEEYGPPIPVNGKRPEWLEDDDDADFKMLFYDDEVFYDALYPASVQDWESIEQIRILASHPYYQSAEYKASVRSDAMNELVALGQEQQIAEAIALLEATGHTVTPPDPLAAEREFLAGLLSRLGFGASADDVRDKGYDREIPAAMEYLTRWADARGNV